MFLVLVLSLPIVYGEVTITSVPKEVYNLGDNILVDGYVLESTSITSNLNINLVCKDKTSLLTAKNVDITANKKFVFSENFIIPSQYSGSCNIKVSLLSKNTGNVVSEGTSKSFSVSKDLDGNFIIKKEKLKLGEGIEFDANITKLDGSVIDGSAIIYIRQDNNTVLIDDRAIKAGSFKYIDLLSNVPVGSYDIDVNAKDSYSNEKLFKDALKFEITADLKIDLELVKGDILPGKALVVGGAAKRNDGSLADVGEAIFTLDGKAYRKEFSGGMFSYDVPIPNDIKSGNHTLNVRVKDQYGSIGSGSLVFDVESVPSSLEVKLMESSLKPQDSLKLTAILYDQANDTIQGKANVEIYDPKNNKEFSELVDLNKISSFTLDRAAMPGTWAVRVFSRNLEKDLSFNVEEVRSANVEITGNFLKVENTGNVEYDDNIEIGLSTEDNSFSLNKKVSVDPGKTFELDLGNEIESGVYEVKVKQDNNKITGFSSVEIKGGEGMMSYDTIYILLAFLVLALFYLLAFAIKKRRRAKKDKEREKRLAERRLKDIREEKDKTKPTLLSQVREEDKRKKEFVDRVLRDVRKREEKREERVDLGRGRGQVNVKPRPKMEDEDFKGKRMSEEEKKELFNMFD